MQGRNRARSEVRAALRDATGAVHERLHRAPPFEAIANQQLDLGEYTEFLGRIAAFHFTVSQDLELDNARPQMLAEDLEELGCSAPQPVRWSFPKTRTARLGMAYVVEGSSLGGKVIYRQLDYLFGRFAAGRQFFLGSASDGPRWHALCCELEAEGQKAEAVDEMVAAATAAFALFEQLVVPWHEHA
jgi:heme oxygenase